MKYFKVSINEQGEEDEVYIEAETREIAQGKFDAMFGRVPEHLLEWKELDQIDIPEGVELL